MFFSFCLRKCLSWKCLRPMCLRICRFSGFTAGRLPQRIPTNEKENILPFVSSIWVTGLGLNPPCWLVSSGRWFQVYRCRSRTDTFAEIRKHEDLEVNPRLNTFCSIDGPTAKQFLLHEHPDKSFDHDLVIGYKVIIKFPNASILGPQFAETIYCIRGILGNNICSLFDSDNRPIQYFHRRERLKPVPTTISPQ